MIKEIVKDTEALSKKSRPATAEDAALLDDLIDTMESIEAGCACLAANQIGSDANLFVYRDEQQNIHHMFNAKMMQAMQPFKAQEECYSLEKETQVTRFAQIGVTYEEYIDGKLEKRKKRFRAFTAQAIQHGIDHCKGRLV